MYKTWMWSFANPFWLVLSRKQYKKNILNILAFQSDHCLWIYPLFWIPCQQYIWSHSWQAECKTGKVVERSKVAVWNIAQSKVSWWQAMISWMWVKGDSSKGSDVQEQERVEVHSLTGDNIKVITPWAWEHFKLSNLCLLSLFPHDWV